MFCKWIETPSSPLDHPLTVLQRVEAHWDLKWSIEQTRVKSTYQHPRIKAYTYPHQRFLFLKRVQRAHFVACSTIKAALSFHLWSSSFRSVTEPTSFFPQLFFLFPLALLVRVFFILLTFVFSVLCDVGEEEQCPSSGLSTWLNLEILNERGR